MGEIAFIEMMMILEGQKKTIRDEAKKANRLLNETEEKMVEVVDNIIFEMLEKQLKRLEDAPVQQFPVGVR